MGSSGKIYYVHPGVLLPFSSSALCTRIHGSWKGTNDDTVDLTEDDEHTIENVIDFFYTRKYHPAQLLPGLPMKTDPDSWENRSQEIMALEILAHARAFSFAHKYLISELEAYATERLTKCLAVMEDYYIEMSPNLADAIRDIYATTPKIAQNAARPLLSNFAARKFTAVSGGLLDNLMVEFGDFRVDFLDRLARQIKDMGQTTLKLEMKCERLDDDLHESNEQLEGWETWNRSLPLSYQRQGFELYH